MKFSSRLKQGHSPSQHSKCLKKKNDNRSDKAERWVQTTIHSAIELTNWRKFFFICPLIDDKLRHNIVKVAVKPRAAGEWFRSKL